MNLLKQYGMTDRFLNEASLYEDLTLARIIAQYKGMYKIITDGGELLAQISGKFRHENDDLEHFPAVGDYAMITIQSEDRATIHNLLTRKSVFLRTAVGLSEQAQVVAANIDTVFICMSLNNNYNLNRLERYISIAFESGASPVIVLTKSDLSENIETIIEEVEKVSAYSDIILTSMYEENLNAKFEKYLQAGSTTAFIGSSGVGKSTIINSILGREILSTQNIDKADKGRHTTTNREMFSTPYGGVVIDTPGMREIGIESAELSMTFADIEDIVKNCKFDDCTHTTEPGCAIKEALKQGLIDERRLENYNKIKTESGYTGLNSKEIEKKKLERMFKDVGGMKNARKAIKQKNNR